MSNGVFTGEDAGRQMQEGNTSEGSTLTTMTEIQIQRLLGLTECQV